MTQDQGQRTDGQQSRAGAQRLRVTQRRAKPLRVWGTLDPAVEQERRETVDDALDQLPVGVWIARAATGEVLFRNEAFRRITGTEPLDGVGMAGIPLAYGIHDRQGRPYPVARLPFTRALESGGPVVVDDMVIHHRDGRRTYLRAFAHSVRDRHGEASQVVVAVTDITAEVRALAERAEIEKHLAVAIHHAPVLLFTMDRNSVLTARDGALRAILEVGGASMVGRALLETYKDHPTVPGFIRRALAGETVSYSVEVRGLVMDVWLGPLRDAAGEVAGAIGVCTDITERTRLQAGIAQADRIRAIGTIAASVAHEINNPLTYVLGGLAEVTNHLDELATELRAAQAAGRDDGGLAAALRRIDRLRDDLAPALAGTERIRQVTRDLSTFTRPDEAQLAPVDLGAVARSVLKLVRKEIEARARLVDEIGPGAVVQGNEARLVQVLINLLMNAWQALPEPDPARAVIGVRTAARGGQAVIDVWDNGPGVPPDLRERIFDPFMTTKDVGEGSGLGLFVCRNIVGALQGNITVGDAPGGGALFRITLPIWKQPTAGPAPLATNPGGAGDQSGRRHILIIDDDVMVARALATRFRGGSFEVRSVLDAREGLAILLTDARMDLVYCDIMMKGLSGIELYEELRRRSPERASKIVFMSGGAFTAEAQTFLQQRPHLFVQKPFDIVGDARRRLGPG
jgi:two-component system, cell cycle sensor histidine kinase and response regulator CckA